MWLIRMGALYIGIGAPIDKNTFEGGGGRRLFEGGRSSEGAKSNYYGISTDALDCYYEFTLVRVDLKTCISKTN